MPEMNLLVLKVGLILGFPPETIDKIDLIPVLEVDVGIHNLIGVQNIIAIDLTLLIFN